MKEELPPHRPGFDHEIELKPDAKLPQATPYGMGEKELRVLLKWIKDNLAKDFIQPSKSHVASPILFVKKPAGGIRVCVDYRGLNAATVRNRYPIPLISETLRRVTKGKVFTKLDIVAAFNKLRVKSGQEPLTAFVTRYGLFESKVMPFGLCGAPGTWQRYINEVLREHLDDFCTAYLDDILIWSENRKEHKEHVRKVLQRLLEAGLTVDIDKCEFYAEKVKYLSFIVGHNRIEMDTAKISAIQEWDAPRAKKHVQSFLGFTNYYRRFIRNYSRLAKPLTELTKKGETFRWNDKAQQAFYTLKQKFLEAPILQGYDWEKLTRLETDASDGAVGAAMFQQNDEGMWMPVAFMSSKMSPAECNYEIYDKELLAIVNAFKEWRPELEGAPETVHVLTDHKNLEYFMTQRTLNRRQAR